MEIKTKEEIIKEQYKEWAPSYEQDKIKIFEKSGVSYEEFMKKFEEVCELQPNINILDVGAGTGLTSIALAKKISGIFKIVALEPIDEMIAILEKNIEKQGFKDYISIKKGNGENIPFDNNSFDLIVSTFSIRHMKIEKALNEFKRVMKDNGRLVLADICAPEKWRTTIGKIFGFLSQALIKRKYKGEKESKIFTTQEWKELLKRLGLKYKEITEYYGKRDANWELKRVILSIQKI